MRLIRVSIALIGILFGVILVTRMVSGTQPNPIAILFTNPDGSPCQMPCLLGVRPGATTLDEGVQILDQHPLTHGMEIHYMSDGVSLRSQEANINIWSSETKLILMIGLDYENNSNPIATPQLVRAMDQALPGNQTLHFGAPRDSLFRDIHPPNLKQRCYLNYMICFNNKQSEVIRPWQFEPFHNLQVVSHPAN